MLGASVFLTFVVSTVNAATVTQCGPTICYEYDDAQVATALYGQPTILGDMLRFLPQNFRAQSDDGDGLVTTSASFVFDRVYSISGNDIHKIMITEFGDYEVTNGDRVSDELTIDVASNTSSETTFDNQLFNSNGDSGGIQTWQLNGDVMVADDFSGSSGDLQVTITNVLEAETDAFGESAWIQKKIEIMATTVPVPGAVWLLGSALGLLGWRSRKAA